MLSGCFKYVYYPKRKETLCKKTEQIQISTNMDYLMIVSKVYNGIILRRQCTVEDYK